MRSEKIFGLKMTGRIVLGAAAAGLSLYFGSLLQPGSNAFATDVAVDLDDGTEETTEPQPTQPVERSVDVYLNEAYNADFGLYELSFNNRYFIYSNVNNGGMTSQPVVIEIPANLNYTVEKDGQPINYKSGTAVDAIGVYVMTIRLDETDGVTTTHYTAVIRFRIMEADAYVTGNDPETSETGVTYNPDADVPMISDEELDEIGRRYDDLTPEEQAALEEFFGGSDASPDDLLNADGTINQARLDEIMAEKLGDIGEIDDIYVKEGINEGTGMASVYDITTGYYQNTLRSGQTFYSDVQNGEVTHLSVSIIGGDGLEFTAYKDGEPYEAEDMKHFSDAGSYMLIPTSSDPVYSEVYQEERPVFSFRIIDNAANDLSLVHTPEGYYIENIWLDELPCESAMQLNAHTVMLREDGNYRIEMSDGEMSLELSYRLDRVRPRFFVQVQKNRADIGYLSTDVTESLVYRNEQFYSGGDIVYTLEDTGKYWFYVYDAAGNYSAQAFEIKYGFNKGAAIAVALLVVAIIGLFVYLRYLNTHIKVR